MESIDDGPVKTSVQSQVRIPRYCKKFAKRSAVFLSAFNVTLGLAMSRILVRFPRVCEYCWMSIAKNSVKVLDLARIPVYLSPNQTLALGQLWKKQTAILVFLRHFACIACRAHAAQVWRERNKYQSSGAKIIFVGNGQPEWIEKFREDLGIDKGVIVTDPSLNSFRLAGFKSGLFNLIQPASALNAAKLAMEGHTQKPFAGDSGSHLQMGGILVVNPKNKVLYQYVSDALGDVPEEPYVEIIINDEAANERSPTR
jgi:hypothetical protein